MTGLGPDELVLEAARVCPAMAIEVFDAGTGEPGRPLSGSRRVLTDRHAR